MMISAHPLGTPVAANVPSLALARSSVTVLVNTSRMPSLGSIALSSLTDDAHSGSARRARVKIPVPAPNLFEQDKQGSHLEMLYTTYSTILSGSVDFTALRICESTNGLYEGRALYTR